MMSGKALTWRQVAVKLHCTETMVIQCYFLYKLMHSEVVLSFSFERYDSMLKMLSEDNLLSTHCVELCNAVCQCMFIPARVCVTC